MDNRIGEMQVFLRVVEERSFSEAARRMRMTPSTVSKLISRMEARLGARLLDRSTRQVLPTVEGQRYYDRSRVLLAELEEMERDLAQDAASLSGSVRITTSVGFGIFAIEPLLPAFLQAYPKVAVDLSLSDEIVDLYGERTDIAFRVGQLSDSSLTATRLGTARRMIIASPAYLQRRGTPRRVEDLAGHTCLGFNFRHHVPVWPLRQGEQIIEHRIESALLANNGETVRRMALAGVGLARMGEFHIRDDLRSGALVEVLSDATAGDSEDVHALFLGTERMPQRVRAFLDFLSPKLRAFLQMGHGDPKAAGP